MICDHLTLVAIQILAEVFDCPNNCKGLQFSDTIVNLTRLKGTACKGNWSGATILLGLGYIAQLLGPLLRHLSPV